MADERPDVLAEAEPFVQQCGPCDFGVIEVGCACPSGDYRPVMARLMEEVRRLRAAAEQVAVDFDVTAAEARDVGLKDDAADAEALAWKIRRDILGAGV